MMADERPEGHARAWNMHQVRHWYRADESEGYRLGLKVLVDLDDPALPVVYLLYFYI
jgi:hypothetical protein